MSAPGAFRWAIWLQWVLAGSVGGAVFAVAARPASIAVGGSVRRALGTVAGETAVGLVAMGVVMLGVVIGQALVLRGHAGWGGWWILAGVVGGALGGAAILGLFEALGGTAGVIAGVAAGLVILGVAQWLLLQGRVPFAPGLVVASMAGLATAFPATALIGPLGFGAAYGAMTGAVIARHLGA